MSGFGSKAEDNATLTNEPVLIVINNGFQRRYFYSARQAARGLGWLVWPGHRKLTAGKVEVYRLDNEATDTLNAQIVKAPRDHDPATGNWLPKTMSNFVAIIRNITGIKEK